MPTGTDYERAHLGLANQTVEPVDLTLGTRKKVFSTLQAGQAKLNLGLPAATETLVTPRVGAMKTEISGAATTAATIVSNHKISYDCTGIRLVYSHFVNNAGTTGIPEDTPAEYIEIIVGLEIVGVATNTVLEVVRFGGKAFVRLNPGAVLVSDVVGIHLSAGDVLRVRTFQTNVISTGYTFMGETGTRTANSAAGWYQNFSGLNDVGFQDNAVTDSTTTPTFATINQAAIGSAAVTGTSGVSGVIPCAILGMCRAPVISVAMLQDSMGDNVYYTTKNVNSKFGFVDDALGGPLGTIPRISMSESADRLEFTAANKATRRFSLARYATHLVNAQSFNDVDQSATFAQLTARAEIVGKMCLNLGVRAWMCTTTPKTTSSDGWMTTGNQAVANGTKEAVRVAFNTWIRAGMALSSGIVIGNVNHPYHGYFDVADAMETARNSGIFKAPGVAAYVATVTTGGTNTFTATGSAFPIGPNPFNSLLIGYVVRNRTNGNVGIVRAGSATGLAIVAGTSFTIGDIVDIFPAYSYDGTHQGIAGRQAAASAINAAASFT